MAGSPWPWNVSATCWPSRGPCTTSVDDPVDAVDVGGYDTDVVLVGTALAVAAGAGVGAGADRTAFAHPAARPATANPSNARRDRDRLTSHHSSGNRGQVRPVAKARMLMGLAGGPDAFTGVRRPVVGRTRCLLIERAG